MVAELVAHDGLDTLSGVVVEHGIGHDDTPSGAEAEDRRVGPGPFPAQVESVDRPEAHRIRKTNGAIGRVSRYIRRPAWWYRAASRCLSGSGVVRGAWKGAASTVSAMGALYHVASPDPLHCDGEGPTPLSVATERGRG